MCHLGVLCLFSVPQFAPSSEIQKLNTSCVRLSWQPPTYPNGRIIKYEVMYLCFRSGGELQRQCPALKFTQWLGFSGMGTSICKGGQSRIKKWVDSNADLSSVSNKFLSYPFNASYLACGIISGQLVVSHSSTKHSRWKSHQNEKTLHGWISDIHWLTHKHRDMSDRSKTKRKYNFTMARISATLSNFAWNRPSYAKYQNSHGEM